MFGNGAEHAPGVFVAHGVAKAVSVVFEAVEKVAHDFIGAGDFFGAGKLLQGEAIGAVVAGDVLDSAGVEVAPFGGGGFGNAKGDGGLAVGGAMGGKAAELEYHSVVVLHNVVSFCF